MLEPYIVGFKRSALNALTLSSWSTYISSGCRYEAENQRQVWTRSVRV